MTFPTPPDRTTWRVWWSLRTAAPSNPPTAGLKSKRWRGQDDYGSMREVLSRRMEEYLAHREEGTGFGRKPDLILLDGGPGARRRRQAAGGQLWPGHPGVRYGQGRPPPHPGHRGGRRGDRHQFPADSLHPHLFHSGGGAPLRHRLPPAAAQILHRFHPDPDRGDPGKPARGRCSGTSDPSRRCGRRAWTSSAPSRE